LYVTFLVFACSAVHPVRVLDTTETVNTVRLPKAIATALVCTDRWKVEVAKKLIMDSS